MNSMFRTFRKLLGMPKAATPKSRSSSRGRATSGFKPSVEQLDERLLPSISPVTPTMGSPLMGIADLRVTYPDGQSVVGSGTMIDSSHVLTTAHLLYSAKDGGYAKSIEAIPGANGAKEPVGAAFGTYERVDPSWLSFSQSNPGATSPNVEDIGLVTLNRAIGNSTGWFAIGYNNNNSFFAGANFQTAGYPAAPGFSGTQMYVGSGKALGAVSSDGIGFAQSSLTALPGQSGSPIWQASSKGSPVIYGVVTGANGLSASSEVYAARITQSVYNELQNWEKADKTPPAFSNATFASQVMLQHPAVTAAQLKGSASSTSAIHALDGQYSQYYAPSFWGYSVVSPWGDTNQYMTDYFTPNDYMRNYTYDQGGILPGTNQLPWWDLWEANAW